MADMHFIYDEVGRGDIIVQLHGFEQKIEILNNQIIKCFPKLIKD
jgi:hypothetical protein